MGEQDLDIRRASAAEAAGALSLDALAGLADALGPERWRAASDVAQVAACYLACHPRVAEVRYPGLKTDPDFGRATSTLRRGFGPRVAWRLADAPVGEWWLWEAVPGDACAQVMGLEGLLAG